MAAAKEKRMQDIISALAVLASSSGGWSWVGKHGGCNVDGSRELPATAPN